MLQTTSQLDLNKEPVMEVFPGYVGNFDQQASPIAGLVEDFPSVL
jgi:hypothetical protein